MGARCLLAAAGLAGVLSCVSGNDMVSCSISPAAPATNQAGAESCEEVPTSVSAELQASCTPSDAGAGGLIFTYSNGPCARAGVIGGCRFTQGIIKATTWWYSNGTAPAPTVADVQARCAAMQPPGMFVSP